MWRNQRNAQRGLLQRRDMPDEKEIESLIGSSFRSVWAMEVLRFLVENPEASFSPEALVAALQVSSVVVHQSLESLSAAGLTMIDEHGAVTFSAASDEELHLVRSAVDYYAKRPNRVRRLIVANRFPGVSAFADAFKLRGD